MHFVVDLETLGTKGTPVILSIAVTTIEPTAPAHREWETVVNIQSCLDYGLSIDGDTILWWLGQSDEARQAIADPEASTLPQALGDLSEWMGMVEPNFRYRYVWSHGATFDAVILNEAYRIVHQITPWQFRNVRDTRTLFHLAEGMKFPKREGKHVAIEDARWTRDSIIAANRYIAKEETDAS